MNPSELTEDMIAKQPKLAIAVIRALEARCEVAEMVATECARAYSKAVTNMVETMKIKADLAND